VSASPALLLVVAMLVLGKVYARSGVLPAHTPDVINRLVIWLFLPALVLKAVHGLKFDPSLLVLIGTPWLLAAVTVVVVLSLQRLLGWAREVSACLLLCVALGNTAFLGYPMIEATLGAAALPYAVVYDQLGSFLLLSSFGVVVVAAYSGARRPPWMTVLRKIVTFPSFGALLLGLLPLPRPPLLEDLIDTLAGLLVPLAMFAVGFQLKLVPPRAYVLPVLAGLGLKLVVLPALAYTIGQLAGAEALLTAVNTMQSAMPAMITAGAMAIDARLAPDLAAALVGYGILISVLWLPLLAKLVLAAL
jgi:malate permease and related proteins